MNAIVEVIDRGTDEGWCWSVVWGSGRHDTGRGATFEVAAEAVAQSLVRAHHSEQIHRYYDEHSHTDSGD